MCDLTGVRHFTDAGGEWVSAKIGATSDAIWDPGNPLGLVPKCEGQGPSGVAKLSHRVGIIRQPRFGLGARPGPPALNLGEDYYPLLMIQ